MTTLTTTAAVEDLLPGDVITHVEGVKLEEPLSLTAYPVEREDGRVEIDDVQTDGGVRRVVFDWDALIEFEATERCELCGLEPATSEARYGGHDPDDGGVWHAKRRIGEDCIEIAQRDSDCYGVWG